jgi:hypothetical protein
LVLLNFTFPVAVKENLFAAAFFDLIFIGILFSHAFSKKSM